MTAESQSRQPTLEQLEAIRKGIGKLLHDVELVFSDNGEGMYPSEVEMTLRLAYTTACRAVRQEATPSEF